MGQERLNNISILHIHKVTDALDSKQVTSDFVSSNDSRLAQFGRLV